MDYVTSLVLGVVEGITEFLPISSTAHLIFVSKLLKITQNDFQKSFEIIIQLGAILAVVWLYWKEIWRWEVIKRLAIAFVPTGIIGLVLYPLVKNYLFESDWVIASSILIGGLLIILIEKLLGKKEGSNATVSSLTYRQCFSVGIFQSLAIIPGVSRAAATILGGMIIKIPRKIIVEFSFLLAVPTMLAATGLDFLKSYQIILADGNLRLLVIGFISSFIMAIFSIKFLISFIGRRDFVPFGWYRIILAILLFVTLLRP